EVHIYAYRRPSGEPVHPAVRAYELLSHTRYLNPAGGHLKRLALTTGALATTKVPRRAILRGAVSVRRGGQATRATSALALLHAASTMTRTAPYDIIHCQFGQLGLAALALRQLGAAQG